MKDCCSHFANMLIRIVEIDILLFIRPGGMLYVSCFFSMHGSVVDLSSGLVLSSKDLRIALAISVRELICPLVILVSVIIYQFICCWLVFAINGIFAAIRNCIIFLYKSVARLDKNVFQLLKKILCYSCSSFNRVLQFYISIITSEKMSPENVC